MSEHAGLGAALAENEREKGTALLMTSSPERMAFMGTVGEEALLDFLETIFRASPGLKALVDEASERAECPVS